MVAFEVIALASTIQVKIRTTMRIISKNCLSVMCFIIGRSRFSENVTDGARRVAEAQLMMAARRAPKNSIWATIGVCLRISVGRMRCESVSMKPLTMSGAISMAE